MLGSKTKSNEMWRGCQECAHLQSFKAEISDPQGGRSFVRWQINSARFCRGAPFRTARSTARELAPKSTENSRVLAANLLGNIYLAVAVMWWSWALILVTGLYCQADSVGAGPCPKRNEQRRTVHLYRSLAEAQFVCNLLV